MHASNVTQGAPDILAGTASEVLMVMPRFLSIVAYTFFSILALLVVYLRREEQSSAESSHEVSQNRLLSTDLKFLTRFEATKRLNSCRMMLHRPEINR